MTGIYYTTADVKKIFCLASYNSLKQKISEGFLPAPDLEGRPNKWLKVKIDDIVDDLNDYQKDET
jgi:hypothetical protein